MIIQLNKLTPAPGSRHRRKIVGRGEGSGHGGKGSTRGFKGQTARSGDKCMKPGFEGGQMPLHRRIPKRGFRNVDFRVEYNVVNVGDLETIFKAGEAVTPESLRAAGLVHRKGLVKILGDGDIRKALSVKADAISESAKKKIEKAGGSVQKIVEKEKACGQKVKK